MGHQCGICVAQEAVLIRSHSHICLYVAIKREASTLIKDCLFQSRRLFVYFFWKAPSSNLFFSPSFNVLPSFPNSYLVFTDIHSTRIIKTNSISPPYAIDSAMSLPEADFRALFGNWTSRNNAARTSLPPLSSWTDYVRSGANNLYESLPTYNNPGVSAPQQEPSWFKLSRFEKIVGFGCCLAASMFCFIFSFFMFPVLALNPRKFALLWTMGSFLFVMSFGILQGPYAYIRHLTSRDRIIFSGIFFGSIVLTMYCALILRSTILTLLASIVEVVAILYYVISYFPFGATTLTWFTSYMVGYFGGLVSAIF